MFTETDECASNPCQNDATCMDFSNGYYCPCVAGYEGANCEIGRFISFIVIKIRQYSIISIGHVI